MRSGAVAPPAGTATVVSADSERGVVLDPVAARCEVVGDLRYELPQATRRRLDERELPVGAASGRADEDGTGDVAGLLGILDAPRVAQ